MGANCQITLPHAVKARDVADVIVACSGVRPEKQYLGARDGWAAYCPGVTVTASPHDPTLANICWRDPAGEEQRVLYFFEWSAAGRGLMPPSTAFWVAVGWRLVEFFGGSVVYNDAEGLTPDFVRPAREDGRVEDGPEWKAFQERKLAVPPLTVEELGEAEACAGTRSG
jgi:hypothetical protein